MHELQPVFTEKAECQDCFKCVRNCPAKAIKVEHNSAVVMPELCVVCGRCVDTCPAGAKHIRNDTGRVRQLLDMKRRVVVSLAPSYVSEFPGIRPEQLATALTRLGFHGVSETALGADQVSAHVRNDLLRNREPRIMVSSACPTAVAMLSRFAPHLATYITPVVSPLLAHARMLKGWFGEETNIVFIGPCIAKKMESDGHSGLLDAALTFQDLRDWLAERELLEALDGLPDTPLTPRRAQGGALYPVDGGMIAGVRADQAGLDAEFMSLSGLTQILEGLEGLDQRPLRKPLFLEVLACEGGCINGPCTTEKGCTVRKRLDVLTAVPSLEIPAADETLGMGMPIEIRPPDERRPSERLIREALQRVGKNRTADEMNCGGCGYESCREFAVALIHQKAEPAMCVSHMRRLAQNKASALIHAMPAGVVIADDQLRIVECNRVFAELSGAEGVIAYDACPGMQGVALEKMVKVTSLFRHVLTSGQAVAHRDVRIGNRLCQATIFTVEPQRLVGAVLADVTQPAIQRGQVIRKAQDVIRKNLATVQQIACLLGENAAESEMILGSIISAFSHDGSVESMDEPN